MRELQIKHRDFSIDEISNIATEGSMPVRRGVHVGNQEPHDLFIECYLPPGIDVLAADSINGNDREAEPRRIRLRDRPVSIAPERYKGKLVGAIPVMEDARDRIRDHGLKVNPVAGESIGAFHMRAIEALEPNNKPVLVSHFFAAHHQLYERVMELAYEGGDVYRAADKRGSIRPFESSMLEQGIFGLDDASSAKEGALPSLNVMMAMDILTAMKKGAEASLHLGGSGMAEYTKDSNRMRAVSSLVGSVASEASLSCGRYSYFIANITPLSNEVDAQEHTSQHELLRSRAGVLI